ncbi:MAG TPA: SUF system NifU family Fe-S cluster assembly protein [Gemmatimonadaceae bacterium]|nr:SUF system NifU family Fe-S cluster assembly protein [Gemmatimonadaceae bacterium]
MSLDSLYQEIILEHNRKPRNFRVMADANRRIDANNPLCGDQLTLWVKLEGDRVADVSFQGLGCAISKASASLMTAAVKGKTAAEAVAIARHMNDLLTGKLDVDKERESLGSLAALSGVSRFPMRVKCASMAWHALEAALDANNAEAVVAGSAS